MSVDARCTIGRMIRILREARGLSQEKLSERAGITYQYLSAMENGKENFTVGVLEAIAAALGTELPELIDHAYYEQASLPIVRKTSFVQEASLPPGLSTAHIETALNETHKVVRLINTTLRRASGRPLSEYIQRNKLSGIVSNILCDSFSRLTPYKHNHARRYPDLVYKKAHGQTIAGLEVKSTIKPGKGGESHNGHSGWHVVACFALDGGSGDIRFIHVMFANLIEHGSPDADWKYVGSKVNETTGSQRTEAYVTKDVGTAKLRHGTVYLDTERVSIARWRTSPKIKAPAYSPFNVAERSRRK